MSPLSGVRFPLQGGAVGPALCVNPGVSGGAPGHAWSSEHLSPTRGFETFANPWAVTPDCFQDEACITALRLSGETRLSSYRTGEGSDRPPPSLSLGSPVSKCRILWPEETSPRPPSPVRRHAPLSVRRPLPGATFRSQQRNTGASERGEQRLRAVKENRQRALPFLPFRSKAS